jgi:hypothetical protein
MAVAMAASSIMFLAIVNVLASNHKDFNRTYDRVNGDVVRDAYTVRLLFDGIMRKASADYIILTVDRMSIEVRYYSSSTAPAVDQFARFDYHKVAETLTLTQGPIGANPTAQIIAHNVTSCTFTRSGPCIYMALVLNDGKTDQTIAVTATRHNE